MVQIIVQHDAAAATVEALGEIGCMMFVDLNEGVTTFQRNFVNEVKICDKMERDLSHISAAMASAGFKAAPEGPPLPHHMAMPELQRILEENAADLRELKENQANLIANYNHLVELSHVLKVSAQQHTGESTAPMRTSWSVPTMRVGWAIQTSCLYA